MVFLTSQHLRPVAEVYKIRFLLWRVPNYTAAEELYSPLATDTQQTHTVIYTRLLFAFQIIPSTTIFVVPFVVSSHQSHCFAFLSCRGLGQSHHPRCSQHLLLMPLQLLKLLLLSLQQCQRRELLLLLECQYILWHKRGFYSRSFTTVLLQKQIIA